MSSQAETLAEILIGAGALNIFTEVAKRLLSRKQAKIDAAAVVQESALELIGPIRNELREARKESQEARSEAATARSEAATARREASDLRRVMGETLEDWLGWMERAKDVLEAHHLPVEPLPQPPIPIRRVQ